MSIAMIPMNFIKVGPDWGHNPREVLEDPIDGLIQISNSCKYFQKDKPKIMDLFFMKDKKFLK